MLKLKKPIKKALQYHPDHAEFYNPENWLKIFNAYLFLLESEQKNDKFIPALDDKSIVIPAVEYKPTGLSEINNLDYFNEASARDQLSSLLFNLLDHITFAALPNNFTFFSTQNFFALGSLGYYTHLSMAYYTALPVNLVNSFNSIYSTSSGSFNRFSAMQMDISYNFSHIYQNILIGRSYGEDQKTYSVHSVNDVRFRNLNIEESIPEHLVCPINAEIFTDPVRPQKMRNCRPLNDLHSYIVLR